MPNCVFCSEMYGEGPNEENKYYKMTCPICGEYYISIYTWDKLCTGCHSQDSEDMASESLRIHEKIRANHLVNIIRENIRANEVNKPIAWKLQEDSQSSLESSNIRNEVLEKFWQSAPSHLNKINGLLNLLVTKSEKKSSPFDPIFIGKKDYFSLGMSNMNELIEWVKACEAENWLRKLNRLKDENFIDLQLTPLGIQEAGKSGINSNKVFIAMKFSGWERYGMNREEVKLVPDQ